MTPLELAEEMNGERWRPIAGTNGRYEISNCGRVRSLYKSTPLGASPRAKPFIRALTPTHKGYLRVKFGGFARAEASVHRLVLETFVGPCPVGMEAAHENGIRTDNRVENLRWKTPRENQADRKRHGTALFGERNPACRIPDVIAQRVRALARDGVRPCEIARQLSLTYNATLKIATGLRRSHS